MSRNKERLEQALKILDTRHFVSIGELALSLDVSEMTVRRDVRKLAETGLVRLVYGGVASPEKNDQKMNYSIEVEQELHTQAKQRIAQRATEFIAPGDVAFLDSGTTVQHFAQCLRPEDAYTIISYSLNTLNVVTKLPECTVIVPGGVFSPRSLVFSGVDAVNVIRKYRANKAFFGATGYEIKHGLTCSYVEECPLKQAVMESSVERILLLDSSKFGKVSTCSFAPMKDFSIVITDKGISPEYAQNIRAQGPELLIVETE
jgi:DeoR family transcriptional regulator, deoxyribose operon repressor